MQNNNMISRSSLNAHINNLPTYSFKVTKNRADMDDKQPEHHYKIMSLPALYVFQSYFLFLEKHNKS